MFELASVFKPDQLENTPIEKVNGKERFKLPDIKDLPSLDKNKLESFKLPNIKDLPPVESQSKDITATNIDGAKFSVLPQTGTWEGEVGNSTWKPDPERVPDPENKKGGNPDKLNWKEISEKYDIEGIEYKDGYPDFSPISKGDVKVEPFTENRDKNFRQADEKLADKWNNESKDDRSWTARDISNWRKENGYTWHECEDCKTMQLVPKEVHNNTPHAGGISEIKNNKLK